jgi:putative integral membrane protein (TIGR02587 family)
VAQAAATARSSTSRRHQADSFGWKEEGQDLLRGIAGGAIIGMPLLFTMEMWQHGMTLSEGHLLGILGAALCLNFLFSLVSGLRESDTPQEALFGAVTAMGIAVLLSGAILWLIGAFAAEMAWSERVGMVVVEAAGVSLGVSFANAYRGRSRTGEEGQQDEETDRPTAPPEDPRRQQLHADLTDLGATLAGATLFALNVAPTEEVLLIAARLGPWDQIALLGATLLLCYIILFASGFKERRVYVDTLFQHPLAETVMACVLSLGVAWVLLLLLGMREVSSHPSTTVAATVVLGTVASVGGAAGRLIV